MSNQFNLSEMKRVVIIASIFLGMSFAPQSLQSKDFSSENCAKPEGSCTITYYQESTGLTYSATAPTCVEAKKMLLAAL